MVVLFSLDRSIAVKCLSEASCRIMEGHFTKADSINPTPNWHALLQSLIQERIVEIAESGP